MSLESTSLGRYSDLHDKNYMYCKSTNWGRVHDCWQQWWDKPKKKKKKKKKTWSPSICRNASTLALTREKQAMLRLDRSQHGEKSLKFHSINSVVEYAKKINFLKQKYVNPFALFVQRYNCVCPCCNPLRIHRHRSGLWEDNGHSFLHLIRSFFSPSWLNEDIFVDIKVQVHTLQIVWICKPNPHNHRSASQTPHRSGVQL